MNIFTDEDIKEIVGPWGDTPIKGYTRSLFDKIEAKLREKQGVNKLRDAAQQALDALGSDNPDIQLRAAVTLRAALAEQQPEPVALPHRQPLTDEELRRCFILTNTAEPLAEGWPGLERFARAIERAHGIGGDK